MSSPYTYLIGWSTHNKWYYGVRHAADCNPNELWKTYFTSSKHVKEFRKQFGEPDVIEIRKTFVDGNAAKLWECKVLKRMQVPYRNDFLNKSYSDGKYQNLKHSAETIEKIRQRAIGRRASIETRRKMTETRKNIKRSLYDMRGLNPKAFLGQVHSAESREKMSIMRKGRVPSAEAIEKTANWHRGKIRSMETRKNISEGLKKSYQRKLQNVGA